ncbi:hypothetical protein ACFJIV_07050 [Mucilaginibacter sp. UC70_90]
MHRICWVFFSTFNSDAIKNINIYKGDMPAQYGGRLSSVLDIKMNDGNNQKFGVSGGIGLIAARIDAGRAYSKGQIFLSDFRTAYICRCFPGLIKRQYCQKKPALFL